MKKGRYDIARKSFSKECHSKEFFPRNVVSKEFDYQGIFLQGIPLQGIFQNTLFHILVKFLHNQIGFLHYDS
jgi:hypothetical protein